MSESFSFPPFPPLKWTKLGWVGQIDLPSWAGYQNSNPDLPPTHNVRLLVLNDHADAFAPPTEYQTTALNYLMKYEFIIAESILNVLFEQYDYQRDEIVPDDDYDPITFFFKDRSLKEREERWEERHRDTLPVVDRPDDLRALMRLESVRISFGYKGDASYTGFDFSCDWDRYGCGVIAHLGNIIEIGEANAAFFNRYR